MAANFVPAVTLILKSLLTRTFGRLARSHGADRLQEGFRLQSAGDEAAAEACYRGVLDADPHSVDAHFLLGSLLGKRERTDEAKAHLLEALARRPDFADAQMALGNVHLLQRDIEAAKACYATAIRLTPGNAAAYSNLGLARQAEFDHAGALQSFMRAFELAPRMPDIVRNLTIERLQLDQYEQSESHLRQLLEERPDEYEVLLSLGFTLQKMHRPERALEYYRRAQSLNNADPELLNNLGIVLQDLGRLDEAIACYSAAIAGRPGFELALWHRSLAYLLRHDFPRGWENYDLRLRSKGWMHRPATKPQWHGEDPAGLVFLIYGEQGIGDEIMFASCLPQMIQASRRCIVECSPKLLPLFRRSFPDAVVRPAESAASPDDEVDVEIAMGSLPQYLRRSTAEFPRHAGYLRADSGLADVWRNRLAAIGPGPKVGISWQGGTYKTRSPLRSIPLEQWAPILGVDGLHFVDLQYTDCGAEVEATEKKSGLRIHRWREAREDFEQTAALVAALDLVISVCTAAIHLGGALGRPVWVLAPFSPEWRYGIQGESMPWYPSVRVFRQASYAVWEPVIEDVAQSLPIWRDDRSFASGQ